MYVAFPVDGESAVTFQLGTDERSFDVKMAAAGLDD
jgi:hypothetical protein